MKVIDILNKMSNGDLKMDLKLDGMDLHIHIMK